MYCNRTGMGFLLIVLFYAGCTHHPPRKPVVFPPEASITQKEYQAALQEKARMVELQKSMVRWEEGLNVLINALQSEIVEDKAMSGKGLLPEGEESLRQKNEILQVLKRMKVLQLQLHQTDTALSREVIYMNLIDLYISGLKWLEKTREKKASVAMDTKRIKEEIEDTYQNKDFNTVIELYRQFPEEGSDLKRQAYYALALAQLARTEETIAFVTQVLAKGFLVTCDSAPLWFEIGEWLITIGQIDSAQKIFQKITLYYQAEEEWYDRSKRKAALLGGDNQHLMVKNKIDQAINLFDEGKGNFSEVYFLCLEAKKNCPDFACQEEVQTFLSQFINRVVADLDERLQAIDRKIAESQLMEAQKIITAVNNSFPGEEYPLPIREKLALVREKEQYLLEKEAGWKDEIAQQRLEQVDTLLESENYEEAIGLLDQLQGTPYEFEAKKRKQLAIDDFARSRRLKAGQLFFQAKNCEDPELKKNYLVESYTLLKDVIDRYPTNSYIEKIRKNLEDVRLEIEKIDPKFFSEKEPPEAGSPELPPDE